MSPKDPKNQKKLKKPLPKIPKIPKDANVKIIEITPKFFLFPLLLILSLVVLVPMIRGYMSDEITERNTKIGLNEIVAQYNSGTYEEIVVRGTTIEAKKKGITKIVNNKKVRSLDTTIIPDNVKITDLGLGNPDIATKVTIQEE
jgi:hypothetical protein